MKERNVLKEGNRKDIKEVDKMAKKKSSTKKKKVVKRKSSIEFKIFESMWGGASIMLGVWWFTLIIGDWKWFSIVIILFGMLLVNDAIKRR